MIWSQRRNQNTQSDKVILEYRKALFSHFRTCLYTLSLYTLKHSFQYFRRKKYSPPSILRFLESWRPLRRVFLPRKEQYLAQLNVFDIITLEIFSLFTCVDFLIGDRYFDKQDAIYLANTLENMGEANNTENTISDVDAIVVKTIDPNSDTCCDVYFLLDMSKSMTDGDFENAKKFIKALLPKVGAYLFTKCQSDGYAFTLHAFIPVKSFMCNLSHLMTKPTKWHVRPAKTQISLGMIRVFAVRIKKDWVLSYPLSAQRRLIRLGGCPGWSVFAERTVILLVLSWGGSFVYEQLIYVPLSASEANLCWRDKKVICLRLDWIGYFDSTVV